MKKQIASKIADSFLLSRGKKIHFENLKDPYLGDSIWRKFLANAYLILADYGKGKFPPKHTNREETFELERLIIQNADCSTPEAMLDAAMRKPWKLKRHFSKQGRDLIKMIETIENNGVQPPAKVLELGCGGGWISEVLALRGFQVTGTSLAEIDIEQAKHRIESLKAKKLNCSLEFIATPMEEVHQHVPNASYDAAFCYEALHHVFDWRESLESIDKCLAPGGFLFLFAEPSFLHTYLCYRSSTVWKMKEIGLRKSELRAQFKKMKYRNIRVMRPFSLFPFTFEDGALGSRAYWVSAQKPEPFVPHPYLNK
jgi:2-polyprenyl-3-methyl-5-hydroxy-6-metoxy-1,4-benzoquinol methylase